uniref:Uncharacterized protein n=1 Tax=Gasterosteus aculeatus TaxID=69293 RepID=G3NS83_GASAC
MGKAMRVTKRAIQGRPSNKTRVQTSRSALLLSHPRPHWTRASRGATSRTDWNRMIFHPCLKPSLCPLTPNQRDRGASLKETKRRVIKHKVTVGKDSLNIKAVFCNEVTPEKGI